VIESLLKVQQKKRLLISFSGGRSSAVMTKLCLEEYKDREIVVVFANTGLEHPATLDFVNDCDRHWGLNVVWLEAVISPEEGVGVRHKVVDYESASRKGEPFEAFIAKYGIPNQVCPKCSEGLKVLPIQSYAKSIGWTDYETAVGIRADEIDRMSSQAGKRKIVYPLVDRGYIKSMVNAVMRNQSFDLQLPGDHYGNCETCFKKSKRKLLTIASQDPSKFDFFLRMEKQYGTFKADGYKAAADDGRRYFFRGHTSTQQLLDDAKTVKFVAYRDQIQTTIWDEPLDLGGACDQGCEVYNDD
jgi:hypothetical protein